MKIGFLFNHDQIHQVAHSLPIALELASSAIGAQVIIATTSERIAEEVKLLCGRHLPQNISFVELRLRRPLSRAVAALTRTALPSSKLLIYRDNLDFFRSLDVLVVAEKTSLILKTRYGLQKLKLVHTRHGAGDRAIGFNKASAAFDHVLVAGPHIRERLITDSMVAPERISVVGYPKFDLFTHEQWPTPFAYPKRPTVLYNPHVSPHLSSWYEMGLSILDWFAGQSRYNLIFAPHVMLFERPFVVTVDKLRIARAGSIPERILRAENIHVDTGSRLSTTMAYVNRADIYLGDVSSQVYEFMLRPRPCIFIDAHHHAWDGDRNFAFWTGGQVITRLDQLGPALDQAETLHAQKYAAVQRQLFDERFDLNGTASSKRAAAAIAKVAGVEYGEATNSR